MTEIAQARKFERRSRKRKLFPGAAMRNDNRIREGGCKDDPKILVSDLAWEVRRVYLTIFPVTEHEPVEARFWPGCCSRMK